MSVEVRYKVYLADGSKEDRPLASTSVSDDYPNLYLSVDCSYERIISVIGDDKQLVAWDVYYTLSETVEHSTSLHRETSYTQRFILANRDDRVREFLFVNCFGMEDRVFGEGIAKRKIDGSASTFVNDGKTMEITNSAETVYEAFSGQLPDRRAVFHWHDFLSSSKRMILRPSDARLARIVVDSYDSETEDFAVGGVSFSYRLSAKHTEFPDGLCDSIGDYDPNQQFGALYVGDNPQVVIPTEEDLFFLKHRLSEFQTLTVSDALLLLVQSPATNAWGSINLGSLKQWLAKFIDTGTRSIRLNALSDYKTDKGTVIDPSVLADGSIPVWNAAAEAYRPVPVSELGQYGFIQTLYPFVVTRGDTVVLTYEPGVKKAVLDISGLASSSDLKSHVNNGAIHVSAAEKNSWNLVASLFGVDEDGNVYVANNRGFYSNSFVSARGSDPEAGSGAGGLDVDELWSVLGASGTEKIDASHIPALSSLSGLLTNAQLANSAISVAGVSVSLGGAVSTAQIASALTAAGYKLTDTIYTLPKATVSALGGIKAAGVRTSAITTTQGGTTSGRYYGVELDSNGKAFVNVPWVNTTYSLSSFGITATAAEINKLDGLATTAAELGYVHGVTSNIQTQLNAKANASALAAYLPLAGGTMTGDIVFNGSRLILGAGNQDTGANFIYSVVEAGGSLAGFFDGMPFFGSIGASTTKALHFRSVTGHATISTSYAAIYNVLDSGNYTNYTVTKTGGGASGTWPIGISGNAASATNATNLAGVAGTKYLYHLRKSGYNIDTVSTLNPRVYEINNPEGTPPTSNAWLQVLMWGSGDSGYGTQLANQYNIEGNLYFRNKISGTWKPWRTLIDNSNYTSYTLNRDAIVSTIGVSGTDLVGWTYNGVARSRVTQAQLRTMLGLGSNAYTSTAYLPLAGGTLTGQLNGRGANFNTGNGSTPFVISRGGLTNEAVAISINDIITRFDVTNDETSASLLFYLSATDTESGGGAAAKTGYVNDILDMNTIYTRYGYGGIQRMRVGWTSADGAYLQNDVSGGAYLSITNTGDLMFNGGKVWHAGNDGSGSGLDADLLDGTHKSGLLTAVASTSAANLSVTVGGTAKVVADLYATYLEGYTAEQVARTMFYVPVARLEDVGWYRIFALGSSYTDAGGANIIVHLRRDYYYSNNEAYSFAITIAYNGGISITQLAGRANARLIDKIRVVYELNAQNTVFVDFHIGTVSAGGNYYNVSGVGPGTFQTPTLVTETPANSVEFNTVNGVGSNLGFVGALTGNADSATKLATARTLWGQSFNGTANVDGAITVTSGNVYLKGGWFQNSVSGQGLYNAVHDARWRADASGWRADKAINADAGLNATTIKATSHVTVGTAGSLNLTKAGSVGLLIDNSFRNLSWTVDTSGGWARSLNATDPTGNTTLMNVAGVFGGGQTPYYVYFGGTDYSSPAMVITAAGNVGIGTTAPAYMLHVTNTGYFGGLLRANAGVQIGGAADIGWYKSGSRLVAGTSVARGVNAGDLLVSNAWADSPKVPTNGIYSKGAVLTDSYLQVGSGRLRWDAANNALYVEKSDGTACGLYSTGFLSSHDVDPGAGTDAGADTGAAVPQYDLLRPRRLASQTCYEGSVTDTTVSPNRVLTVSDQPPMLRFRGGKPGNGWSVEVYVRTSGGKNSKYRRVLTAPISECTADSGWKNTVYEAVVLPWSLMRIFFEKFDPTAGRFHSTPYVGATVGAAWANLVANCRKGSGVTSFTSIEKKRWYSPGADGGSIRSQASCLYVYAYFGVRLANDTLGVHGDMKTFTISLRKATSSNLGNNDLSFTMRTD